MLKLIVFVFLIYFVRRVWGLYKLSQQNMRPPQGPGPRKNSSSDIEAEYTIVSEESSK